MGSKCPDEFEAGMILTLTGSSEFEADHHFCKDLVYMQHKTSSGRTNCFWKIILPAAWALGDYFWEVWWSDGEVLIQLWWWPLATYYTLCGLQTLWQLWQLLDGVMHLDLNEASFELCWQPDSWDIWHQHCNLGTGKVKHMRNDSAYLLDLRSGMDNMQMHLSGGMLKPIENQSENPFSSCVSWELHISIRTGKVQLQNVKMLWICNFQTWNAATNNFSRW